MFVLPNLNYVDDLLPKESQGFDWLELVLCLGLRFNQQFTLNVRFTNIWLKIVCTDYFGDAVTLYKVFVTA